MIRQKSILSFFHKTSPENRTSAAAKTTAPSAPQSNPEDRTIKPVVNPPPPSDDVRGTDTPPEKVPRQVLPANYVANTKNSGSCLFESIMHKFIKVDDGEKVNQRSQSSNPDSFPKPSPSSNIFTDTNRKGLQKEVAAAFEPLVKAKDNAVNFKEKVSHDNTFRSQSSNHDSFPRPSPPSSIFTNTNRKGLQRDAAAFEPVVKAKDNAVNFKQKVNSGNTFLFENDDDITGPETPGMQPLTSNVKRKVEDVSKLSSLRDSGKRVRFLDDSISLDMTKKELEIASKFEWLDPSRIRDANGRRPDDPLYDRTTLYIPPEVLRKMTASQKQYWSVKCKYMDVLLFFKVGKFYELYEMDAEIGHKELDWKITLSGVGKCRQVGISESGIDDAVKNLVARGYKVGRVEQLETSEEAKARGANSVIQRKLVQVVTPSTNVDGNIGPDANHLLAIKEESNGSDNGSVTYGFAFVDCARLRLWVGSIDDDASCSALGALLMQVSPKEIIYERRGVSKEAEKAFRKFSLNGSTTLQLTPMRSITDLVTSEISDLIHSKGYFKGSSNSLDHVLTNVIHCEITLSALGGLIGHLNRLMLDEVLQNGDIYPYQVYKGCLKMDGPTYINLEIFGNSNDGGKAGTLYKYLDNCVTSSGKRLLRNWICCPLKDAEGINNRLDVVDHLIASPVIVSHIAQHLRKLPDLELLLGRTKSSLKVSSPILLPLLVKKILKQRNHDVTDTDAETLTILAELFLEKANQWFEVVHAINCIDVLRSFAVTSSFSCGTMSRPVIVPTSKSTSKDSGAPVLKMKGLWHPFALGETGREPVPNDMILGENEGGHHPRTLLLTGPNMGGKSTLLRATCLAVIMAQLGCYVPCENCVLSVVDIIFTRLGATDRIMAGESTFFIECTETASVLHNATQDSLVILDELGRGTSTFDGYAIAYAVFRHLIEKVNCRLLFATHYHPLTKEFASHPRVTMQHMACAFKSKSDTLSKQDQELVFLYRLAPGACPESYGLQVALMAGIPEKTVNVASKASQQMKISIGKNFRSSEQRSEFSSLHEEWLKTLMSIARIEDVESFDDDVLDTLVCLRYELKSSFKSGN
ncbi:DNA mismatch repair protein MSH7 isoform X2 [Medicago truncatula]|uniref:DNA mismatch repair protein MSH7 isoform X2 n=1 Tax=Medicago truncatula TaxID=3880 RepID=UPI000D2F1900|nr:DNA mismatch repair protein MSH7 isoform X2 [Medicago truncatula]